MKFTDTRKKLALYFLLASAMGTVAWWGCSPDRAEQAAQRPNIILLLSDELQFEDLSYFGGTIPTPRLDALAKEGLVFTNAYAVAPMCTPSRYALLSGQYPGRCTYPKFLADNPPGEPYCIGWDTFIDSSLLTLPRLLSKAGYVTGMAGKWHLGEEAFANTLLAEAGPLDAPETNDRLKRHQQRVAEKVKRDAGFDEARSVAYSNFDNFPLEALRYHNFPWLSWGALGFIEQQAKKEQPFFLYLASTAVHGPHHAAGLERDFSYTPEGRVEEVKDYQLNIQKLKAAIDTMASPQSHRYAGMAFLDHQLGLVVDKLKELNIEDNTILIFLPDHNTEPGKATCYEKGLQIPIIIKWPGKTSPRKNTATMARNIDLLPTILEMAGVALPEEAAIDGTSLLPAIENADTVLQDYVFAESGYTRSVSDGRFKYIALRYPSGLIEKMETGQIDYAPNYLGKKWQGQSIIAARFYPHYFDADQLYDLDKDPYEQENLAYLPAYAEKRSELQQQLQSHLSGFQHPFPLADTAFLNTEKFDRLAEKTKALRPEDIEWYPRDWGEIHWPPVE